MTEYAESTGTSTLETGTSTTDYGAGTANFINPDGSFMEGWQGKYVPQEYRHLEQVFSGIKTPADMAKMIGNQNAVISRQGKGIFPPGENANESEIKAFHKAIGVPDTIDGYTLTIPEDVKKYYQDQELMTEAKTAMLQLGLTPKQFAGVMALDAKRMMQSEESMKSDPMAFYEQALELAMPVMKAEAEKQLRLKWGEAFDARLQLANAAITENTQEGDERNQLLERVGNDPLVADFIATIQNKHHTESHGVDTSLGTGAKTMNVDQQIQAIMNNPHYLDGKTNPVEHHRLVDLVNNLMSKKTSGKMLE
jgi:hypothetical protein